MGNKGKGSAIRYALNRIYPKNMADIINLNATHTMVLTHPDIGTKIESFLKYGRFVK